MDPTVNDGNKPVQYTTNDWFYLKSKPGDICDHLANPQNKGECAENSQTVTDLQISTDNFGASMTQYNDAKMLYNRELLFTVNILIGLAMLLYYIYLNQDVLPNVGAAISNLNISGVPSMIPKK